MIVTAVDVNWWFGCANLPTLELYVDALPTPDKLKYERYPAPQGGTLYYAETDQGYVDFKYHNPQDQEGYGGRLFAFPCTDGYTDEVYGPWSSNSAAVKEITGNDVVEVDYLPSKYGYRVRGAATIVFVMLMLSHFRPDLEMRIGPHGFYAPCVKGKPAKWECNHINRLSTDYSFAP